MYYKLTQDGVVVDVFDKSIDDFIALQNKFPEQVEEIERKEYNRLEKLFDEQDDEDNKAHPDSITFSKMMGEIKYTSIQKKMSLLSLFSENTTLPTIDQLEKYYVWLNKKD